MRRGEDAAPGADRTEGAHHDGSPVAGRTADGPRAENGPRTADAPGGRELPRAHDEPSDRGSHPGPVGAPEPAGRPAGTPGAAPRGALLRRLFPRTVVLTLLAGTLLHVAWLLLFANSGGDLAAQDAWAEFAGRHPDSAYNLAWYGGMHPVSYSVISPYLMHVLGVRTTMMIAGTLSCGLLALILTRCGAVKHPLPTALAGAFALVCNAISGRVTFGLGLMFALGAVAVVFSWPRTWRSRAQLYTRAGAAAVLAALATAASPVAGLFLGMVAAALFLDRRRAAAYALGVTPTLVVGVSALLFPFSGTQPMTFGSVVLPLAFAVLGVLLVPAGWRTVRLCSAVYALGILLSWIVDSQIGSNVTRLALLFAGVVFLAAMPRTPHRSRRWIALCVAVVGVTVWQTVKTVSDVVNTRPAASWAREVAPLIDRLDRSDADRGRVEVVPARSHREASALAPYVNLARGWNRQADRERNPLFYEEGMLTRDSYRAWLKRWAVRYVVLSHDEPDFAGQEEAKLVGAGVPYLTEVWSDRNWKIYRVADPTPLADPPAVVRHSDAGELTVTVRSAGPVLIRVPYSPWLGLVDRQGNRVESPEPDADGRGFTNLHGCLTRTVRPAPGGAPEDEWTELHAPRAGTYRIASPYQLPRGTPCPDAG
ncbi:MFS transporter [Streptomyces sp. NPDC001922]|uniref:MFS transporter n=1 Tax=Streptomyces sp. NPDC001922 TaxID=3364624 RepID=UPI0036B984EB